MRQALFLLTLLLTAAPLIGQEFDVFDLNDLMDPRVHGALYDRHGKLTDRGDVVRIVRVATGGISDYAWRSAPTHDNVGFVHIVGSEYVGNFQANVKATFLEGQHDNALPRYRLMTQFAHYMLHEANSEVKKSGAERIAGRAMVSVAVEDNRLDQITGTRLRRFNTEIAAEFDLAMSLPRGRNASGSLIWTSRQSAIAGGPPPVCTPDCGVNITPIVLKPDGSSATNPDPGHMQRTQRLSYYYRLEEHTIANRYRLGLNFGFGGEKTDRWRWGATRAGLHGAMEAGAVGTLNVTWTPTFVPRSAGKRTTQEVAIFFDRTVFASLAH